MVFLNIGHKLLFKLGVPKRTVCAWSFTYCSKSKSNALKSNALVFSCNSVVFSSWEIVFFLSVQAAGKQSVPSSVEDVSLGHWLENVDLTEPPGSFLLLIL